MSESNVMPKSFIDRVNTLAHCTSVEEPLFVELEQTFCGLMQGSPLDVATDAEWEDLNALLDTLHLSHDERAKWDEIISALVSRTQSAAFACGLLAGAPAALLFNVNGKKGK